MQVAHCTFFLTTTKSVDYSSLIESAGSLFQSCENHSCPVFWVEINKFILKNLVIIYKNGQLNICLWCLDKIWIQTFFINQQSRFTKNES